MGEVKEEKFVVIGAYTISRFDATSYWIEHESGEGFQIKGSFLEKEIERIYKENF